MLRKIRITAAAVFFTVITLLLLDFTGTLHAWFGWMAKVQLLPAVLAVNAGVVAALVLLTLLFGRVYCSVICPLGVFQDVVSRAAARAAEEPLPLLAGAVVAALRHTGAVPRGAGRPFQARVEPAGALQRLRAYRVQPFCTPLPVGQQPAGLSGRASRQLCVLHGRCLGQGRRDAGRGGRDVHRAGRAGMAQRPNYCNTVCPVGTILGLVSRFAVFKPRIDTSKCNGCGLCARNCKASCIDAKTHRIDYSRCVACMDCLGKCRQGAISFSRKPAADRKPDAGHKPDAVEPATLKAAVAAGEPADASRRKFLSLVGVMACATVRAQEKKVDGGLAVIEQKKIPRRTTPITPPGSLAVRNMEAHCTGCQLCVAVCPN